MDCAFDLLGDPIPVGRGRAGRPEHMPTAENRAFVTLLLASERKPEDIAAALGVSMPTLRKHYFSELAKRSTQRLRVKGRLLVSAMTKAMAQDMGAIKFVNAEMDKAALGTAAAAVPAKARAEPPVGKKEQQRQRAYEAGKGSEWGDLTRH